MNLRRCIFGLLLMIAVVLSIAAALAAVAWNSLAARGGEWSYPVRFTLAGHVFEQDVSMAVLLRAATHPLAARVIDGRALTTPQGRWQVSARNDGSIAARCEPPPDHTGEDGEGERAEHGPARARAVRRPGGRRGR